MRRITFTPLDWGLLQPKLAKAASATIFFLKTRICFIMNGNWGLI